MVVAITLPKRSLRTLDTTSPSLTARFPPRNTPSAGTSDGGYGRLAETRHPAGLLGPVFEASRTVCRRIRTHLRGVSAKDAARTDDMLPESFGDLQRGGQNHLPDGGPSCSGGSTATEWINQATKASFSLAFTCSTAHTAVERCCPCLSMRYSMLNAEPTSLEADREAIAGWMAGDLITDSVARFVEGPGIKQLDVNFDINELRSALQQVVERVGFVGDLQAGFGIVPLTRRPGTFEDSDNDLSGLYWIRADERYVEEPMEEVVDEAAFSELIPEFADTYFAHVHEELTSRVPIGRMRLLSKGLYNCNSWHRDPEPRIHVPIISNPGSLFVVNHHVTHLPADGSAYFTDTRGYHTAMNGGLVNRVHLVAAIPA